MNVLWTRELDVGVKCLLPSGRLWRACANGELVGGVLGASDGRVGSGRRRTDSETLRRHRLTRLDLSFIATRPGRSAV